MWVHEEMAGERATAEKRGSPKRSKKSEITQRRKKVDR